MGGRALPLGTGLQDFQGVAVGHQHRDPVWIRRGLPLQPGNQGSAAAALSTPQGFPSGLAASWSQMRR
ncbi:MAG: hypothetical protein ACI9IO_000391 [Cyanobium sp.]|jgi:hypothetical protein